MLNSHPPSYKYRCRFCKEIFGEQGLVLGEITPIKKVENQIRYLCENALKYVPDNISSVGDTIYPYSFHKCYDGNVGIGDLIGIYIHPSQR